jgi:hypothetical protein
MSVIVKGMKMPESCFKCRIYCKEFGESAVSDNDFHTKRLENCPLVELPKKHGRLIDVDEYCKLQGCDGEDDDCKNCVIRDCKTILESEE